MNKKNLVFCFFAILFYVVKGQQITLDVPWTSQWYVNCPTGGATTSALCGPTSLEMAFAYYEGRPANITNVFNYLPTNTIACGRPGGYWYYEMRSMAIARGYQAEDITTSDPRVTNDWNTTLNFVEFCLNQNALLLINVKYSLGLITTGNPNHWVVIVGIDRLTNEIIINDPGRSLGNQNQADHKRYSFTTLQNSWSSNRRAVLLAKQPNQGLPIFAGDRNNPRNFGLFIRKSQVNNEIPTAINNLKIGGINLSASAPVALSNWSSSDIPYVFNAQTVSTSYALLNNSTFYTISFDVTTNASHTYHFSCIDKAYLKSDLELLTPLPQFGWVNEYIPKGLKWGFFKGQGGLASTTFGAASPLTRGQAASIIVTAAVYAHVPNRFVNLSNARNFGATFVDQQCEFFAAIHTLRNWNIVLGNDPFNPNDPILLKDFCRWLDIAMNFSPLDEAASFVFLSQPRVVINVVGNDAAEYLMRMTRLTKIVQQMDDGLNLGKYEPLINCADYSQFGQNQALFGQITISGNEIVTRGKMAKYITNAFNAAYYKYNNNVFPGINGGGGQPSVSEVFNINDVVIIGEKFENSDQPTGSAPAPIQQTYNVASGGSITLQYNSDYDTQGNPMHFYWSMEKNGATLVSNTATHRSVTFTAPTVTSPTDWNLYAYNANNRGKSNEVLITIHVGGTQGSNNAPPSQQAYSLNVGGATTSSLTASWTRGNGQFCMVTCTEDNYNPNQPVNGITYVGNSNYNNAPLTDPGDDSRVVYAGTGNSVTVTGLQSNHSYRFNVYEYNVATGNYALYNYWSVPSVAGSTLGNNPPPVSDFTYSNNISQGQTATFTSTAQNYTSLTWTVGGGASISGSNTSATCDINFPSAGSYQVDLLAYNISNGLQDIETKFIYVYPQTAMTADLYVQAMSVTTPQYVSGQPLTISCSVNNGGIGTYISSSISYFLSSDSILNELTDWPMGQESYNVAAGQAVFVTHVANNIQNNLSGQYYILAKADYVYQTPNGYIAESNENNNIGILPLMVVQALPDLIALSVSATPTTLASGSLFSVTGTFQNVGLGDACWSCPSPMADLWISTDNQLSPDDISLGNTLSFNTGDLCSGCPATSGSNSIVRLPWTLTDGNYFLIAAIDFAFGGLGYGVDWNSETSESNNWVATPITILSPNQPTINASNLAIINVDTNQMRVSWTRGNGAGCLVIATGDWPYSAPNLTRDGVSYTANPDITQASGITSFSGGIDNYSKVVYDGTGTFVDVYGLNSGETYSFYVLEYNGVGANRDYFQVTPYAISSYTLAPNPTGGWKQILGHNSNSSYVNEVHFFDLNNGFVVKKSKPQFALTSDGGNTWKLRNILLHDAYFNMFPQSIVWIGTTGWELESVGGRVHKTTDAGMTWTSLPHTFNRYSYDMMFRTVNEGYMACGSAGNNVDDDGAVLKTTDGGVTWSLVKTFNSALHSIYFIDAQTGWATSHDLNQLFIFRTTDGGVTWASTPIDRQNVGNGWRIRKMYFQTNQIGYAATSTNFLLKTTNGGVSWSAVHQAPPTQSGGESTVEIEFLNSSVGFVKWGNNYLSRTDDGGMSWITGDRIQTFDYNATIGGLSIIDANTIFVCGMGGLYKTTTSGNSNAIDLQSAQSSYCAGSPIDIPYAITGTFDVSNIFTVQLSDSVGSFASPSDLQTFTNVGNGTLTAVLPSTIQGGAAYRVRLNASNPAIVSDTTSAFAILNSTAVSVSVAADSLVICENETATFMASATNGGTAPTYVWKLNGSIVGGNSNQYSSSSLQDGDVVWVEMASNALCANTTPVVSTPLEIEVTGVDVPFIQAIDSLLAASTDIGVQWYLNGQPISGATGQFYTASQSGFYQVRVTIDGCTAVSALFSYTHIPTASDPEQEELQDVAVFPNPTSGGFTIRIGSKPLVGARVKVYNVLQVPIYDAPLVGNVAEIDLGNQPSGAYFVRIETRNGQVSKVVIKQ